MATINRIKAALTRKLGPLPAWAWALVALVAVYIYRTRDTLTRSAIADDTTPASTGTGETPDPVVLSLGESVYDPATGVLTGTAPEQQPAPEPVAPPDPVPPRDPVVVEPGEQVFDPESGALVGGATGGSKNDAGAAANTKKTKLQTRGSGLKREWKWPNGKWHHVPPPGDASINQRRRVGKKVQYWWGNKWHSKPYKKNRTTASPAGTMATVSSPKPTTRNGGGAKPRVSGRPVATIPGAILSRIRSSPALPPVLKSTGSGGALPTVSRSRDNLGTAPTVSARSVPLSSAPGPAIRQRTQTPLVVNPATQQVAPAPPPQLAHAPALPPITKQQPKATKARKR